MNNKIYFPLLALAGILFLGAFLRFHGITFQSFWDDEFNSWYMACNPKIVDVKSLKNDVNPPLYYFLLRPVITYAGKSEAILRTSSAIFGILSILAIYLLGRRIYSYREGLIAAGLMAVLEKPIFYSQEVRAYSVLILFSIVSAYCLIPVAKSLKNNGKLPLLPALGYLSSGLILSYLHYFGLFLVALQALGIAVFLRNTDHLKKAAGLYLIIFIGYLPWIPFLTAQFEICAHDASAWINKPDPSAYVSFIKFLFSSSATTVPFIITMYSLLLVFWQRKELKGRNDALNATAYLFLWFIIPFTIIYLLSKSFFPALIYRYLLISLPAALLLLARSITILPIPAIFKAAVAGIMLCSFLYQLLFSSNYYQRVQKAQWRRAVHYLTSKKEIYENSYVIISNPSTYHLPVDKDSYVKPHPLALYYFDDVDPFNYESKCIDLRSLNDLSYKGLRRLLREKKKRYLSFIVEDQTPYKDYMRVLSRRFRLVDSKDFICTGTYIFEQREAGSAFVLE